MKPIFIILLSLFGICTLLTVIVLLIEIRLKKDESEDIYYPLTGPDEQV